jgi:hypothetical protein
LPRLTNLEKFLKLATGFVAAIGTAATGLAMLINSLRH